jgi:Agenet domain
MVLSESVGHKLVADVYRVSCVSSAKSMAPRGPLRPAAVAWIKPGAQCEVSGLYVCHSGARPEVSFWCTAQLTASPSPPSCSFFRSKSEGFPGAWLEATVVSVGDDRDVTVEYAKLRTTDHEDSPLLRETVKVNRYATVSAASGEHGPCGGAPGPEGRLESGLSSRGSMCA